jgi:hypothetical protein
MTSACSFVSGPTILQRFLLGLAASCVWLATGSARAQIGQPRSHINYALELEPHFVVQWDHEPAWASDGLGVGLRASIPLIQDGPVPSINNSFALSVGLDWAHFGDDCYGPGPGPGPRYFCGANDFWVPILVQWNFFFSSLISAFPELGLGLHHTRWDGNWCAQGPRLVYCGGPYSDTGVDFVLFLGVRFHLAKSFALTLRLGTPSLLLGASFFI